jgi:heme/copper-type cytochrome/quinol oxidase subunit 3
LILQVIGAAFDLTGAVQLTNRRMRMQATLTHDQQMPNPLGLTPIKFGLWLFLASEIMFFTGLLGSFIVLRIAQPEIFHEQASELSWPLAGFNTLVLIGSSFTMALGVARAQDGKPKEASSFLLFTLLLGLVFLGVKAFEYSHQFQHGIFPSSSLFFASYFTMTGCHGLHVIAGLIPMFRLFLKGRKGTLTAEGAELLGLYWHFVDLVWIFLFPLLYLL